MRKILLALMLMLPMAAQAQTPPLFAVNAKYLGYGGAGAGTANAQTVTYSPAITLYTIGQVVSWTPSAANTGAATLNVNALGAKTIVKAGGTALAANDLTTTALALAWYDGTDFELLDPQTGAGGSVGCGSLPALTGNVTTTAGSCATTIATVYQRRTCDIAIGDVSGTAISNGQLGPQPRICYVPAAATVVEMDVAADNGTPNIIVAVNHAGSDSNIVSSALATAASGGIACSNTGGTTGIDGVTTCSGTLQNTSIAAGDYIELVSGTAGGTAKLMTVHIIYTLN